jgi:hypothetical protein
MGFKKSRKYRSLKKRRQTKRRRFLNKKGVNRQQGG